MTTQERKRRASRSRSKAPASQTEDRTPRSEPRTLWTEGHAAFRERDYGRAAALFEAFLAAPADGATGVDPAAAHLQLGITFLRLKRNEEGVAQLQRSVQLDPYNGRTRYKLGAGLARLGRSEEALDSLSQAVRLAPDVADHQWRHGEELWRHSRKAEAREAVLRALELDPGHVEAQATLRKLRERSWWGRVVFPVHRRVVRPALALLAKGRKASARRGPAGGRRHAAEIT
jgi:tetratricopeptide (TPR) repeat protein